MENNSAKMWALGILVGATFLVIVWQWSNINPIQDVAQSNQSDIWQQIKQATEETGQNISDSFTLGTERLNDIADEAAKVEKQQALVNEAREYLNEKNNTTTTSTENITE